eukprot:SAG11_NODE_1023_length_6154_cov_3.841288_6_plen_299_part_00
MPLPEPWQHPQGSRTLPIFPEACATEVMRRRVSASGAYESAGSMSKQERARRLAARVVPPRWRLALAHLATLCWGCGCGWGVMRAAARGEACGRWAAGWLSAAVLALALWAMIEVGLALGRALVLHYAHNRRWRRLFPSDPRPPSAEEVQAVFMSFDLDGSGCECTRQCTPVAARCCGVLLFLLPRFCPCVSDAPGYGADLEPLELFRVVRALELRSGVLAKLSKADLSSALNRMDKDSDGAKPVASKALDLRFRLQTDPSVLLCSSSARARWITWINRAGALHTMDTFESGAMCAHI